MRMRSFENKLGVVNLPWMWTSTDEIKSLGYIGDSLFVTKI